MLVGPAVGQLATGVEAESFHWDSYALANKLDTFHQFRQIHFQLTQEVSKKLIGTHSIIKDEIRALGQ